jgi:hypothetical protein
VLWWWWWQWGVVAVTVEDEAVMGSAHVMLSPMPSNTKGSPISSVKRQSNHVALGDDAQRVSSEPT